MRILICGSRDCGDVQDVYSTIEKELENITITKIIHGSANGVDTCAHLWAMSKNIPVEEFVPDWHKHGKKAGILRNIQMLKVGKPDQVIAFWNGSSPGTKHMISVAKKAGVLVKVVRI